MTGNEILLSLSHKKGNKEVFFRNITNLKLAKEIIFQTWWNQAMRLLKTYVSHKMHRVYLRPILMQWKGGRYVAVLIIIMYRNATI